MSLHGIYIATWQSWLFDAVIRSKQLDSMEPYYTGPLPLTLEAHLKLHQTRPLEAFF